VFYEWNFLLLKMSLKFSHINEREWEATTSKHSPTSTSSLEWKLNFARQTRCWHWRWLSRECLLLSQFLVVARCKVKEELKDELAWDDLPDVFTTLKSWKWRDRSLRRRNANEIVIGSLS
jgi:hypothetical protein